MPLSGSACTAADAECGYTTQANPCGAADCYCQGGAWNCGPTCIYVYPTDASPDSAVGALDSATTADGFEPTEEAGATDAGADTYSGPCIISGSSYDQSCTLATDCAIVAASDYCSNDCQCSASAISISAVAQFNEDVSKTPRGLDAFGPSTWWCEAHGAACCRGGQCQTGIMACSAPSDTLAACADAGGTCRVLASGTDCAPHGPSDSCAYADETCCVP
jgi:hypothetical protein